MNNLLYLYLAAGLLVGLLTLRHRALFSEGPARRSDSPPTWFDGPMFWVAFCLFWWPVTLLTGLNTAWIMSKRKKGLRA